MSKSCTFVLLLATALLSWANSELRTQPASWIEVSTSTLDSQIANVSQLRSEVNTTTLDSQAANVSQSENLSFPIARQLQVDSIYDSLEFTAEDGTSHPHVVRVDSDSDEAVALIAGVPYLTVVLRGKAPLSLPNTSKSLLKLVPQEMTEAEAQAGKCSQTTVPDADQVLVGNIEGEFSDGVVTWDIPNQKANQRSMSFPSRRRSLFRVGGYFKFCYTDSGSWASGATLVPSQYARVVVHGVLMFYGWPYTQEYRHKCFAGRVDGTNCKVRMDEIVGNTSAESDWTRTNRLTWATPVSWEDTCGIGEALPTLGNGVLSSPFMLGGQSGVVFDLGTTSNVYDARNYWLCYCSNFNEDGEGLSCTDKADFRQEVGYLIVFTVTQFVATIVPATRFDLKVTCGDVNGCADNLDNRIRVLDPTSWNPVLNANNLPIWDAKSGCRIDPQSTHYVSPPNCVDVTVCSALVNGGDNVDFKIFRGLKMDNSVVSGLTETRQFDLCFCNEDCLYNVNWLKVGAFHISKAQLVPNASDALEVVHTPGYIQLNTVQNNYPDAQGGITNSFASRNSYVKLLVESLGAIDVSDAECAREMPPAVFENHGCVHPWQCYPYGWKNETSQIVVFNAWFYHGGLYGQAFTDDPLVQEESLKVTALRAGMYAVCYCEDTCEEVAHWAKLTRLEIRGPHSSQYWKYQTTIPFNMRVTGVGLSTRNRMKIILKTSRCDDDEVANWDKLHVGEVYQPYFKSTLLSSNSFLWSYSGHTDGNPIVAISDWAGVGTTLDFAHDARGIINPRTDFTAGDVLKIGNITVDKSGVFPYIAPASAAHEEILTESWGHLITSQLDNDEKGTRYGIPALLRHPDGQVPTWSADLRASWTRTSEELYEQLEAIEARKNLRVCWSDSGTAGANFVAEAGTLELEDAPLMTYSTANLVSTTVGVVSPLVLAFKTSVASRAKYEAAENSMMLKILIQDDHLEARASNLEGDELADDSEHRHNDVERADQTLCGKLFKELWSSHVHGFPVPRGCFYVHRDKSYVIVFGPQNGLAGSAEYQIVMNTKLLGLPSEPSHWAKRAAVRLWSLDDVVLRREFAVEVGACFLNPNRIPQTSTPAIGSQSPTAQFSSDGFKLVSHSAEGRRLSAGVLDLTVPPNLKTVTFELRVLPSAPVVQGHHLRVFLSPLTQWRLIESCTASCEFVDAPPDFECGSDEDQPSCSAKPLCAHDGAQRNYALIGLPQYIDALTNSSALRISLPDLEVPTHGFFPSHISAELTNKDDMYPNYATSTGMLLYIPPKLQFGGVVNSIAGDGNAQPFRGDELNELYVRLQLGATLRSYSTSDAEMLAAMTLILPKSYTCVQAGVAPQNLAVFGNVVPQGRGDLPGASVYGSFGAWKLEDNTCRYTLKPRAALFAGSAIFVHLVVDNPAYSLPSADPRNVWYLSVESYGESEELQKPPEQPLQGDGGQYSGNIAVQGKLVASLSPLRFTPGSHANELRIFFFTEQGAGQRAKVKIFGPKAYPFDFGKRCVPGLLDERYYVSMGNAQPTFPLPGMTRQITCEGLQSTSEPWRYYGASLSLSGRLRGGYQYGFVIRVSNPDTFVMSLTEEWSIITYTVDGSEIDGTYFTVPLHHRQVERRSFGLYHYQPTAADLATSFVLTLQPTLPTSVTGYPSYLAIGGIQFPAETSCRLKAVAPSLYEWIYVSREFLYRADEVLPLLPNEGRLLDGSRLVDSTLPVGFVPAPVIEPLNEIVWPNPGSFRVGQRYGFAATIRVPNRPNTASINSFFLQCGFEDTALVNRPLAAISSVPLVAALVDASVGYMTNIISASNRLRFQIRTTTAISSSGALVIQGPPGFLAPPLCSAQSNSKTIRERLNTLRARFLQYESMTQRQQIVFLTAGPDAPEYQELTNRIALEETALKTLLTNMWKERVAGNALPIDVGCRFEEPRDTRPTVQITLQVGLPNLDVDSRMASFVRRNSPDIFQAGQAFEAWLPVSLYRFEVLVTNPSDVRSNEQFFGDEETVSESGAEIQEEFQMLPCGFEQCWKFAAYRAPFSLYEPSDKAAAATGFPIVTKMKEAFLVDLHPDQRRAVRRNDHPRQPNQLIFAFTLQQVLPEAVDPSVPVTQVLHLKGPTDYTFPEDCAVLTDRGEVFGSPELWPSDLDLANWTNETGAITGCSGLGSLATITVSGGGEGLLPGRRYAFRIDILENPKATPDWNMWTLMLSGHRESTEHPRHSESSEPFYGLDMWTFLDLQIVPRTTERSSGLKNDVNGGAVLNIVTVLLKTFNTVPGPGGVFRLQGPNGYHIQRSTSRVSNLTQTDEEQIGTEIFCDAHLVERPENLSAATIAAMESGSLGVSFWDKLETVCFIHPLFPNVLLLELVGNQDVQSAKEYALIVPMVNPEYEVAYAAPFELTSQQPPPEMYELGKTSAERGSSLILEFGGLELLDIADVLGFPITKSVEQFTVTPETGSSARGGELILDRMVMQFVEPVFPNDILRVTVPPTYLLRAPADSTSTNPANRNRCLHVDNLSRPGAMSGQNLRCYFGLDCLLKLWGVNMRADSQVQLHRMDRHCGQLPGAGINIRRTLADPSDSTISKSYNLGLDMDLGKFRVCYCHGDTGCSRYEDFCQEVGNLTILDLCAGNSCPTAARSCLTRCDPRSGKCLPDLSPDAEVPDGSKCNTDTIAAGVCEAGVCISSSASTSSNSQTRLLQSDDVAQEIVETSMSCIFDTFSCDNRSLAWHVGHEGYEHSVPLHLEVAVLHPELAPPENDDFIVVHERGGVVRSSRVIEAYDIRPQFRAVSCALVGNLKAGGSLSTLDLYVVPVSPASSVWIRAKEPIGFDFELAQVDGNGTIISALGDTIEIAATLVPLQQLLLHIDGVRLPLQGGQGFFDVLAFNGTELRDSAQNVAVFRTPAHVDISEALLVNQFKRDTTGNFRVEASFGNRLGEWARLQFRLRFSNSFPSHCRLRISVPSWLFSPLSATVHELRDDGTEPIPLNMSLASEGQPREDGSATALDIVLHNVLKSQQQSSYALAVDAYAPESSQCACWVAGTCSLCNSNWTVEILDGGALPLATNDGLFVGFPLVSLYTWQIFTNRAPPQALLNLTVRFTAVGAVHAEQLIVTAPIGYEFPYSCLAVSYEGRDFANIPMFTSCVGRLNVAVLNLREDGLFRTTTVTIVSQTPRALASDNRWYLEGRTVFGNMQVGWGVAVGLTAEDLRNVFIDYANIESLETYFLIRFTSEVDVPDGGSIVVLPPSGYLLKCAGFIPYALPISGLEGYSVGCSELRQGVSINFVQATLRAAMEYTFSVAGTTASLLSSGFGDNIYKEGPEGDSTENIFIVQILEQHGRVVESNYDVPASDLVTFGGVVAPYLLWYDTPSAGAKIWVTIGLNLPLHAPPGLLALRITLPEGVRHAVMVTSRDHTDRGASFVSRLTAPRLNPPGTFSDFLTWSQRDISESLAAGENSSDELATEVPVEPERRRWLDLGRGDEVEVRFEANKKFPACESLLRFPVTLPNTMPVVNMWRVSLVFDRDSEVVAGLPGDGEPTSSFVVPGFKFGERCVSSKLERAEHIFEEKELDYYAFSKMIADGAPGLWRDEPCAKLVVLSVLVVAVLSLGRQ